jgi:hypothetical protein
MPDDAEFRDELRAVVRKHDPDPSTLDAVAADLETLADRWRDAEDVL